MCTILCTNNNPNVVMQHSDLSMKKSGCIKAYIHKKNKTKGVKDTKCNIFINILILNNNMIKLGLLLNYLYWLYMIFKI